MMEDVMVCVVLTGMPKCAVPSRINAALVSADRKSTRLNSSHDQISYAVFCLKKKKKLTRKWSGIGSAGSPPLDTPSPLSTPLAPRCPPCVVVFDGRTRTLHSPWPETDRPLAL